MRIPFTLGPVLSSISTSKGGARGKCPWRLNRKHEDVSVWHLYWDAIQQTWQLRHWHQTLSAALLLKWVHPAVGESERGNSSDKSTSNVPELDTGSSSGAQGCQAALTSIFCLVLWPIHGSICAFFFTEGKDVTYFLFHWHLQQAVQCIESHPEIHFYAL